MKHSLSKTKNHISMIDDDDDISISISTSYVRNNEILLKRKKTIAEKIRIIAKWFSSIF